MVPIVARDLLKAEMAHMVQAADPRAEHFALSADHIALGASYPANSGAEASDVDHVVVEICLELTRDHRIGTKFRSEVPESFFACFQRLIEVRTSPECALGGDPDSCNRVEYFMRSVWGCCGHFNDHFGASGDNIR